MKPKSNKQKLKKKNEFRYHEVEIRRDDELLIKIRHPAYVFLEKGNLYIYVVITHSSRVKNCLVIKLRKNPNPKDKRDAFRVVEIKEDTKDRFGRREKGWRMNSEDEQDIRDEYKKKPK